MQINPDNARLVALDVERRGLKAFTIENLALVHEALLHYSRFEAEQSDQGLSNYWLRLANQIEARLSSTSRQEGMFLHPVDWQHILLALRATSTQIMTRETYDALKFAAEHFEGYGLSHLQHGHSWTGVGIAAVLRLLIPDGK